MDIKDVENLAELARIELDLNEKEQVLKDMNVILEYVKTIEETKTGDTVPKHDIYNVWREDEIGPREFSRDLIVSQFPDSEDGFLKVKKIL